MTTLEYFRNAGHATPAYIIIAEGGYPCGFESLDYQAIAAAINWSCRTDRPCAVVAPGGRCAWTVKLPSGAWSIEDGDLS